MRYDHGSNILFHTFYRYLVMLGLPSIEDISDKEGRKVVEIITRSLQESSRPRRGPASYGINYQYQKDCERYSLRFGNNVQMSTARTRLESVPGGMELCCKMLSFDAKERPSMKEVLLSPVFEAFREENLTEFPSGEVMFDSTEYARCSDNDVINV